MKVVVVAHPDGTFYIARNAQYASFDKLPSNLKEPVSVLIAAACDRFTEVPGFGTVYRVDNGSLVVVIGDKA